VSAFARCDVHLLLQGEHGTGKAEVAAAIHRQSRRADRRFSVVAVRTLSGQEVEHQLLGGGGKLGVLTASGGTAYIDEVEALPGRLQGELAQALAAGPGPAAIRVIVGTSSPIDDCTAVTRVRPDLRSRLAITRLTLPPLRERREDIGPMAECCIRRWAERSCTSPVVLTDEALAELTSHTWPGNTRELERTIAAACIVEEGRPITAAAIRSVLGSRPRRSAAADVVPFREIERRYMLAALERCGWNQSLAARRLRIGRNTLIRKLHTFGLERPAAEPRASEIELSSSIGAHSIGSVRCTIGA
jgi:two-component system response regulator AtoC/two-component system response regulator HupR/HoxA